MSGTVQTDLQLVDIVELAQLADEISAGTEYRPVFVLVVLVTVQVRAPVFVHDTRASASIRTAMSTAMRVCW